MSFQFKLKYYTSEDSEYTAESSCDKELIEKIIRDYWTDEELPNGLELIVVSHTNGELIILEHSGKEVFEVYFLRPSQSVLYHKKSRIDLIYSTLSAFMDNDFPWLENNLNRTKNENRHIRNLIISKHFRYGLEPPRLWAQLSQTLLFGIPLGLTFSIASIVTMTKLPGGIFMDILLPFVFFLGLVLWIPGLIIHFQYKKDNEKFSIRLTKGSDLINVEVSGLNKELSKSDISKSPLLKIPGTNYPGRTMVTRKLNSKMAT